MPNLSSPCPSILPELALLDPLTPKLNNPCSGTHKQTDGRYAKREEWLPRRKARTPPSQTGNPLSRRGLREAERAQPSCTESERKINYENISVSLFVNFPWPWDAAAGSVPVPPCALALVFLMSV